MTDKPVPPIIIEPDVRVRHTSGSPDRQTLRRRHSSAEDRRAKPEPARRSWSETSRHDRICLYKVKSTGCIPRKDPSAPVAKTSPLANERIIELKCDYVDSGPLRLGDGLCSGETSSTTNRKYKIAKTFHTLIGRDKQLSMEEIPNIAVMGSGGGVRAMVALSSIFCTLHKENLLQYILYAAGLSGSSWYLTTLYSHPKWPKVTPEIIHDEIKKRVVEGLLSKIFDLLRAPGTWFSNLVLKMRPMNFTELFGLFLSYRLIPDRYEVRWSDQKEKLETGNVPFPLLACIHAKTDTPAKDYHEWVELSPFEMALPKYGIGIDVSYFGSQFESGKVIKELEELPLYYLNGICGSAFTILEEELKNCRKGFRDAIDSAIENEQKAKEEQIVCEETVKTIGCSATDNKDTSIVNGKHIPINAERSSDTGERVLTKESTTTTKKQHCQTPSQGSHTTNGTQNGHHKKKDVPEGKWDVPDGNLHVTDGKLDVPDEKWNVPDRTLNAHGRETVQSLALEENVLTVTEQRGVEITTNDKVQVIITGENIHVDAEVEDGGIPILISGDDFDVNLESNGNGANTDKEEDPVFDRNDTERLQRVKDECPGWLKDFVSEAVKDYTDGQTQSGGEDEVDGIIADGFSYVKNLFKRAVLERRDFLGRAASLYNPLRKLSFEELSTSIKAKASELKIFSRIFEKAEDEELLCFVDAGLAFNSPYPVILRHQRSVDLILSFDFTDRNEVNGDPFKEVRYAKKWADLHRVKFPPIPKLAPDEEVRELYILEDEHDPLCPTIMHFVLVNKQFKEFSKPGVPRKSEKEKKFADFDLFKDDACPYNSQRFQFTEEEFERLSKLSEFIVLNKKQAIIDQIKKTTERRMACKTNAKD